MNVLPLSEMEERHVGLTPSVAQANLEAARVCLDRHHVSPSVFTISSPDVSEAQVQWERTDERCRNAWANETDATEQGAYACVLAATELIFGLVAVHRAHTRTGADYYIAPAGAAPSDLESCLRLEVSGLDRGSAAELASRLNEKIEQARKGRSSLPAMAGVVGFLQRRIGLRSVEEG